MTTHDTKAVNTGKDFEKLSVGNFQSVAIGVFGLGMQRKEYKDRNSGELTSKLEKQARVVWEVNKRDSEGKRFFIGKTYNLSVHEKSTMAQHMKSWLGITVDEEFDLASVKGKQCLLNIIHSQTDYPMIASVGPLPEGMDAIAQEQEIPLAMMKKIDENASNAIVDPNAAVPETDVNSDIDGQDGAYGGETKAPW